MNASTPEDRLSAAGHTLPAPPQPRGNYAPFHLHTGPAGSQHLSLSGQTSRIDGIAVRGSCSGEASVEPARAAARVAMLNLLAALALAAGGKLPERLRITRVRGFVRSTADFTSHTRVLDAASDLLRIAWPDTPLPSRTVVGVVSLPDGAYIEVELDAEIG